MYKFKGIEYNVFEMADGKFEALIFDVYRRVYAKSYPCETREDAISRAHAIIKNLKKGFSYPGGIIIDEGKAIRDAETEKFKITKWKK